MVSRALRRGPAILITIVGVVLVALSLRPTGTEPLWLVIVGRTVPLVLVGAGAAQWFAGRTVGSVAATMAGLSWAAVSWGMVSVTRSDPLIGIGLLLAPMLVPWLVLLIADLPTPWRPSRSMSFAVVAFVGIGLTGMLRALVYEPLLDLHCGPFCGHSPVLVTSNAAFAAVLGIVATWTTIIVCGSVGLSILVALLRRRHTSHANVSAILVIGGMATLAGAAIASLGRVASPTQADAALVVVAQAGACVAIAIAAIVVAFDRLAVRRNLAEVARLLGAQDEPLEVEAILRRAIGDPSLRVGYWTDDMGYIGVDGLPLGDVDAGRQRTELTSRGRPIAVLIHSDSLSSDFLDEHIGPQARLAIQNESLQLQLRRQVDELRASRRRIVEVGEAERRSLERDLHDGAQQLLLALSFELRRGERAAAAVGDATSTALFAGARETASRTLDQLRVLAHGIHPGILTGAGLEDALVSYAATVTPMPKLTIDLGGRLSEDAEAAVYAIVTRSIEAVPGAKVEIKRHAETVSVSMDGVYDAPEYVLDRLGAAGGSSVRSSQGLELVVPCA